MSQHQVSSPEREEREERAERWHRQKADALVLIEPDWWLRMECGQVAEESAGHAGHRSKWRQYFGFLWR